MAEPLIATMAPGLPLIAGCQVAWEAIDPTTGNAVSGVVVVDPTLYGLDLTDYTEAATLSEETPLFIPLPVGTETE